MVLVYGGTGPPGTSQLDRLLYIPIDFKEDGLHTVTVNRDPEQYLCTSIEEDAEALNSLLDWWTQDPYDHYNEWLSETCDALKDAGKK